MVKTWNSWLAEGGRDMQQPISLEIEAGKVKVYADPEAEDWTGEIPRAALYKDMLEDIQTAIKQENLQNLKTVLKNLRDTPLFGQDTSNVWKMSQIDGVEDYGSGTTNSVMWAGRYAARKIQLFLDWTTKQ
jgi:hypothetical protein